MPAQFAHLRSHTEYSIVDSSLRVDELIAKAKADGQAAVAITDINSMFGAIHFYTKARAAGIKPIMGVEVIVEGQPSQADPEIKEPDHKVALLSDSDEGYFKLMRLISRAQIQNLRKGQPMLREEWLAEEGSEGLICLSGDENGAVGSQAAAGDLDKAAATAKRWSELFPDRYYIEIQRRGVENETEYVQGCVNVADTLGLPLVATHPLQFAERDDYLAHEVKVCDKRKDILQARERERSFTPEQHFKTAAEMSEMFSDIPDAIANTMAIAERCNASITLGRPMLPDFETPPGMSPTDYFRHRAEEGLERRLEKLYPDAAIRDQQRARYQERLAFEMDTITEMKFEGYFLIVQDFIQWAKEHDIPVGPGRGSGAGSLVAYALTITDLDPLEYNLLFERFLNPERVSMPDFDIDFCMDRRELVIDYVTKRYGAEAVAGICNITTLQSKGAIKAAGRALGLPVGQVEGISKLIPTVPGKVVTIAEVMENEIAFRERYDQDESIRKLVDYALKLEGLPHGISRHASGVIIAPGKLTDFTPLHILDGSTQPVSQYDKDDVEKAGLVKFDFLGLKTLTELDYATKLIKKMEGHETFDLTAIPLDDAETYEIFQKADTMSVFQFESEGMRRMLKEAKPDRFADLVALVSLYRPGPMDLIPDFINRKHGREEVKYPDPRVEGILSETYGIMVYQEQVMQMAQIIGGYSLGGADLLRRAMGKKKPEEMAAHRVTFSNGAAKRGVPADKAGKIYDTMEKFAGYGFNKSHAAAYALLSYQTAYIKKRFPSAFYASWMTVEGQEDTAVIPPMIEDAARHGVKILPPNINSSDVSFTPGVANTNELLYGLAGLKGLGRPAADHIVQTRKAKGEFTDLIDFCKKVGKGFINKRAIDILIKAGAFDTLHPNREESLAYAPLALKYLDKVADQEKKAASALSELFELAGAAPKAKKKTAKVVEPPPVPEWVQLPEQEILTKLKGEKESFGFYFSDNPFRFFKTQMGDLKGCLPLADILEIQPNWDKHWVAGLVKGVKPINGRGGKFAIVTLTDGDTEMEVKLFSEIYESTKSWLKEDQFVLFSATIKEDKFRGGIAYQAVEARDMTGAKALLADNLNVALPLDRLAELQTAAALKPGPLPLLIWHPVEVDGKSTYARVPGAHLSVAFDEEFIKELSEAYGAKHVKVRYKQSPMAPVKDPKPAWGSKRGR